MLFDFCFKADKAFWEAKLTQVRNKSAEAHKR